MALSLGSIPPERSIPMQQTPPGNPVFVKLDPKYRCLQCRNVLRDAVQTLCGHRMCEACATALFESNDPVRCPGNEDTCIPELKKEEIFRDPSARREIRLLGVYCTYKDSGCKQELPWKDLEAHVLVCEYRGVECPYKEAGCRMENIFKVIKAHKLECNYRPIQCEHCGVTISLHHQQQKHEERDCRNILVDCDYGCGCERMPRFQMIEHLRVCPRKPIRCKFHNVGCTYEGSEEDVIQHQNEAMDVHLQYITVYTANMDLQSMEIRRELQDVTVSRDSLHKSVDNMKREQGGLKESIDGVKHNLKELKLKVVAQTERVIHLERKVEDLVRKDLVDKHSRDIQTVKDGLTTLTDRVAQIERTGNTGSSAGGSNAGGNEEIGAPGGTVPIDTRNVNDTQPHAPSDICQNRLQHHERQIGLQDVRLAELNLRLQIHETASFNGTLMWKIRDYARRKQEAITRRTLSLYSQPFYTSQFGYKMCARVYLNGDGMGKGTHLSLFFIIMRGDFDALLPWPFKQRVTMVLLDQENGTRNLTDTFRPDPTSNSFKKPTTEMNIASGCPLFVSHAVLETRTYLHEDTIYIKIIIEQDDLNPP